MPRQRRSIFALIDSLEASTAEEPTPQPELDDIQRAIMTRMSEMMGYKRILEDMLDVRAMRNDLAELKRYRNPNRSVVGMVAALMLVVSDKRASATMRRLA
eukprot:gene24338-29570_t